MTSNILHILAMIFMLIDHVGAVLFPRYLILRCIGRLAFPIYAFMIVEGFKHTRNLKKYTLRMFTFAFVSEIPFNLLVSKNIFDPYHQNVLWTFIVALICMYVISRLKNKAFIPIVVLIGYYLGIVLKTDYKGAGVLMVLTFYLFDAKLLQLLWMYVINVLLMKSYVLSVGNFYFEIQALAIFSLLFIWLYNGKKGVKSKWFQYLCYAFYPLHMAILVIIAMI